MKNIDKNKHCSAIETALSTEADAGSGDAGLAARQLLAESIISAGASFTDQSQVGKASCKGKGKSKKGASPRQARHHDLRINT